ncbi:unnamed protein product (macronuclear) [Paramecium tetraurelia]|uniref:Uncharacterized protein n=1 Tax=Paramecium tetraurelia TaxID=5888 RepID=A0C9X2_PARTE|nr:uncharacterized protein GSPATT00006896001 [Paramecium tetraurelia]CAK67589.1 unnamed protein product [Paramecium tetraurelia]|eukprot:XP_001434986.1 hypothetical protein (macronuclear) [Paramecium tetraurelia strain d4-2]
MFNPQKLYIQQNSNFEINQFSCNKHKQPFTFIDLSQMCEREYRMKCSECQLDLNCIPFDIFGNLCENIYQNIDQNNFQVARTVLKKFQKEIEEIQGLLQQLNNKLIRISSTQRPTSNCLELLNSFVNCIKKQSNEKLGAFMNTQQDQILKKFGIKQFQELAEVLSKNTILNQQNYNYTLKFKDIDDQQLAESNQYFEFTQNLKQQILNFKQENDIKNVENIFAQQVNQLNGQIIQQQQKYYKAQRIYEIQKSEIMLLKENQSIADIQLNFDQSMLYIRFMEPNNYLSIWKYDPEKKKWNFSTQLQCYIQSLIDFKMSKLENAFVTCGEDSRQNPAYVSNLSQNNNSIKIWKQEGYTWIEKQIYKPVVQNGHGFSRNQLSSFEQI